MKVSPLLLASFLGFASILSLSQAATESAHAGHDHSTDTHSECTEHDHSENEHQHDKSKECSYHEHEEGEPCSGNHYHEGEQNNAVPISEDMVSITIDDKARNSLDMKVEKVVPRSPFAAKSFYGQMEIPPHAVNTYALPAAGRVKLHVQSAQRVKKGDILYTLDSPEILELKAKADEGRAALARNQFELDTLLARQKQLGEIGTKNSELDTSIRFKQAERPGLEMSSENSSRKFAQALDGAELSGATLFVRADKDGAVQSVGMTRGAWGDQGTTVLVLTNPGQLEFKTTAHAAEPLKSSRARLVLDDPEGKESIILDGHTRISDQINKDNQTRTIYFVPDKLPSWSFEGQLAKLEMHSTANDKNEYIPIPNSAVVKVGINDVVFIQDKEQANKFIMKKVAILAPRRGMTPVKGLIEGQTIVTKGGYELKYAIPAQGGEKKAAGHFHADGKFHEGEH